MTKTEMVKAVADADITCPAEKRPIDNKDIFLK